MGVGVGVGVGAGACVGVGVGVGEAPKGLVCQRLVMVLVPMSIVVHQGSQITSPAGLRAPPASSRVVPFVDVVQRPRTRRLSRSCDEFLLLRHLRSRHIPPHPLLSSPPLGHAVAPSTQPLGRRVHALLQLRGICGSQYVAFAVVSLSTIAVRASRTPAWRLIRAAATSAAQQQRQDDAGGEPSGDQGQPSPYPPRNALLRAAMHATCCCARGAP